MISCAKNYTCEQCSFSGLPSIFCTIEWGVLHPRHTNRAWEHVFSPDIKFLVTPVTGGQGLYPHCAAHAMHQDLIETMLRVEN